MKSALIGHGLVAPTYLKAIADAPDLSLSVICGRTMDRVQSFAATHEQDARLSTDIADVARDPEIDFVIIATPPNARGKAVEVLARAGKPILTEKPLERSFDAARVIVERCERAQVPLGVMFQHRAREPAQRLKAMLEDGALGDLAAVEISVPWWRDQSYYDAPGRGTYAQDGGGVLITQAIHTLDLALHLLGPVRSVQAMARRSALHQMEVEDFVTAGLEFASGAYGSLLASTASYPGRGEQIVIHASKGSAVLEAGGLTVNLRDGSCERFGQQVQSGGGADPMNFTHAWHQTVIEDFAQSLRSGSDPLCSGRDALVVHAVIDALIRSSDTKTMQEVEYGPG